MNFKLCLKFVQKKTKTPLGWLYRLSKTSKVSRLSDMSMFFHYLSIIIDLPVYVLTTPLDYLHGYPLWEGAIHNRLLVDTFLWIDGLVCLVIAFGFIRIVDYKGSNAKMSNLLVLFIFLGIVLLIVSQLLLNEQLLHGMLPIFFIFTMASISLMKDMAHV